MALIPGPGGHYCNRLDTPGKNRTRCRHESSDIKHSMYYPIFPTRFFFSHSHHLCPLGPTHLLYHRIPHNASATGVEILPRGYKRVRDAEYGTLFPERSTTNCTYKHNNYRTLHTRLLPNLPLSLTFSRVFSSCGSTT